MSRKKRKYHLFCTSIVWLCFFLFSCKSKTDEQVLFEMLDSKTTGLHFSNTLSFTKEFNLFNYMYFYNGSGVGAGDFNNDGLADLFFASNQQQNKLFINNGKLKFKDVTKEAAIPDDKGWSTGVSVVDINNDGLLDIYVCRVGQFETLRSKNQLLINTGINKNGVPLFTDKAKEYGLDFSGFSTQAAFFDYDNDGDLDMYLLNHAVHEDGSYRPRAEFINTYSTLSGDRIFRNDGTVFTDVTKQTGINSSAIGYGLGIAVADINTDGYPDIYIGNDFHENDYLYINQKDGTFKEEGTNQLMHTSQYSMGVDVADVNNDAYPEIISLDMLPSDPYILKRSLGEDANDIFDMKINYGYSYQYSRNNLQYNRGNGLFSEVGLYSGIAATDWSWAPLWMDFDNDGLKDLFISNGIPKRLNDIDYINFVSNNELAANIRSNKINENDSSLIQNFPEIKLPNKFYKNNGQFSFTDTHAIIQNNQPSFSNGSVYADFDNDGDLDIAVNNINAPVFLYENKTSDRNTNSSVAIQLKGPAKNRNAIGSKLLVFSKGEIRSYEKNTARGFLSSMEIPIHIGLGKATIDSLLLIWPDNTCERIMAIGKNQQSINYKVGLPKFNYQLIAGNQINTINEVTDITKESGLNYLHQENSFPEFDREPLMPHMLSVEGPALAVGDMNKDGLDDVFIGSARDKKSALFLQQSTGKFLKSDQPSLDKDSAYEDTDACWTDVNNDGHLDLIVASGGNEFFGTDTHNTPRVYLNNGKSNLIRKENAFKNLYLTASCIVPFDFNKDGFADLFIGGRAVPYEYGKIPRSYLLLNDTKGNFTDVTAAYAKELSNVGFVTNARCIDLENDGDKDLVISLELGCITAFVNENGKFIAKQLTDKKGWWNFLLPADVDGDGDIDFVAGNLGLNSRLKASGKEPVRLYYNDFDNNGKSEAILTYYLAGKEIPFANKTDLEKQLPYLKKKFLYADDFAKASLTELFGADKLSNAVVSSADYFSSAVLINKGNLHFEIKALPWLAQLSSMKDAVLINANNDNLPDIFLAGNDYSGNAALGRYDADFGTILINKGNGEFTAQRIKGVSVKGQVRKIKPINIRNKKAVAVARNNETLMLIQFNNPANK